MTQKLPDSQPPSPGGRKLLDLYRDAIRMKHYSFRTEKTYVLWVREFILFHKKRHPREMGTAEINQFLSYLASEKKVSASTQNQAMSAILFLYRHVLHIELDESLLSGFRPQQKKTVPTVLSKDVKTTMIYTHVLQRGGLAVKSPLDT